MRVKESFRRFTGPLIVAGSLGLVAGACNSPRQIEPTLQPIPKVTATKELSPQHREEWSNLSPINRINSLELKNYPRSPDFDPTQELIKATSELYCQIVPCAIGAEDMQKKVHLFENDRYLEIIGMILGKGFRDQEKKNSEGVVVPIPDSMKRQNREMFINGTKVGQDLKILKNLLFSGYSHLNQSDEDFPFEPFDLVDSSGTKVTIGRISRLMFVGVQDNERSSIDGTVKAMDTRVMSIINQVIPVEGIKDQNVSDAGVLLQQLMDLAGINKQDFLSYYVGQKPIEEYLLRLGAINEKPFLESQFVDGRVMFFVVGALGNGIISNDGARKAIEDIIKRPLPDNFKYPSTNL